MRKFSLRLPSPAVVLSFAALLVALGGTSYAAITALPRNSVGTKQLKDHAVTAKKLANEPHFIAPTLNTGYSNFGNGFANAGYEKDLLGFVHLRGTLNCPTGSGFAFTLPTGYRPSSNVLTTEATNFGTNWLNVFSSGAVRTNSADGICAIDGVTFPAAGTAGTSAVAAPSRPRSTIGSVR